MNLCCKKGHYLTYKHSIRLDLNSGFDFQGDFIFVNKHRIQKVHGENPTIKINPEKEKFFCERCSSSYLFKDTYVYCENCGKLVVQRLSKKLGSSLLVCRPCNKVIKTYRAFDIFKLLTSSKLSELNEIDVDNFHEYSWTEVLERFGGEEVSTPPENVADFIVETVDRNNDEDMEAPVRFRSAVQGLREGLGGLDIGRSNASTPNNELSEEARRMQDNLE
ncbi:hypothetical protein LCGC14_1154200 [marine sediment metagenome]|uniref:Uncharacterized protein n=1 Tax=marine sediment metagenome TaxID=412755 RepID=A0A0F9LUK8_9ZZZZ